MHAGQYIIIGEEIYVSGYVFDGPDHAAAEAAKIARQHPGQTIHVAYIMDSVIEPLPELRWASQYVPSPAPSASKPLREDGCSASPMQDGGQAVGASYNKSLVPDTHLGVPQQLGRKEVNRA